MWAQIGQEEVAITKKIEMDLAYLEENEGKHHQHGHDMEPQWRSKQSRINCDKGAR